MLFGIDFHVGETLAFFAVLCTEHTPVKLDYMFLVYISILKTGMWG